MDDDLKAFMKREVKFNLALLEDLFKFEPDTPRKVTHKNAFIKRLKKETAALQRCLTD